MASVRTLSSHFLRNCWKGAPSVQIFSRLSTTAVRAPANSEAAAYDHDNNQEGSASQELIEMEEKYSAHNYHPLPVVFSKAKGADVWDPEGRHYLDFLSAYSAVNQGHGHPHVLAAISEQLQRVALTSRAFYNDQLPQFAKVLTSMFGYDMMLPMNTGAEAVETALKVARKWGYQKKGIPKDEALIVSCCGCFHGRTLAVISMSCDNEATKEFGPLLPGHLKVDFGDLEALDKVFQEHGDRIAGFLFEPIQGEAGVVIPPPGYVAGVRELCTKYNVLMMADEVQTGIARTGKLLACEWEGVRPDVVILGKALGAGVVPVSAVLADKDVMLCIKPGEHGSTFGGNPLACAVGIAALQVIQQENLANRADVSGQRLRQLLSEVRNEFPKYIKDIRGRGLLTAIEMNSDGLPSGVTAYDVCLGLKDRGILAKPTHETIIRLAPPLSISESEIDEAVKAFRDVLSVDMPSLQAQASKRAPAHTAPEPCHRCGRIKGQASPGRL